MQLHMVVSGNKRQSNASGCVLQMCVTYGITTATVLHVRKVCCFEQIGRKPAET